MDSEPPSVDALYAIEKDELQNLKTFLTRLYSLWKEFGINDDQKIQRGRTVWKHIKNLLQEILEEELVFYEDIKERIRNYSLKIEELSKVLCISVTKENITSLIKKEENLRLELDNLTKLKHKRIKSYQELRNTEAVYCSLLGIKEHQLSTNNGIPSESDLREIEQHIKMLKAEKDVRYRKLCKVKRELTTILEITEIEPETKLEKDIISGSDTVSLTNDTLKALEEVVSKAQRKKAELEIKKKELVEKLSALWNRLNVPDSEKVRFMSQHMDCKVSTVNSIQKELERCEQIKRENTRMYIENLRQELNQIWDKCYVSVSDRAQFDFYYQSKEATDEVLKAHEAEVEKWGNYFEEVKSILSKIEERKKLWDLLLIFENKANDPNRFKNRRGNLLKEEKDRKKLQKDLPSLENNISDEINMYEATSGKMFKYYGEDFREFVSKQWQERNDHKENERLERHKQRLLQTENEVALGTPAKRPLSNAPKSAPSKLFKSNTGMSVFRTPTNNKSKAIPSTNTKCPSSNKSKATPTSTSAKSVLANSRFVNAVRKSGVNCKLFSSSTSRPNFIKKKDQYVLRERNKNSEEQNTTTYSQFAGELNSTSRRSFRSSVLSAKKVGGTRISQNNSKSKRKSSSKTLRRSMRNTSKTTPSLTPARGKLGLPFLI